MSIFQTRQTLTSHRSTQRNTNGARIPMNDENAYPSDRNTITSQNGHSTYGVTAMDTNSRGRHNGGKDVELSYLSPTKVNGDKPRSVKETSTSSSADSETDIYSNSTRSDMDRKAGDAPTDPELDDSKWIHRDKLARIENEELQAAGIFLPRTRDRARSKSQNRPRRDHSQDKANGQRSRKNSSATLEPRTPDLSTMGQAWDLRLPEEIAEEGGDKYWVSNGGPKGLSRIPVAKQSPVPIPSEHLERDTVLPRTRDRSPGEDETIVYPKPRTRSGSTGTLLTKPTVTGLAPQTQAHSNKRVDSSPGKGTAAARGRKVSVPRSANGSAGRPKTRGGPSRDSTSTRPSTRSGERELSLSTSPRQMEGEPPWMVSAYRPDPRLPPDQQLLPTVARRLQQEKWEREGKFGSVYDKEFRPLTDEGFMKPPEVDPSTPKEDEKKESSDWPLKPESKSPTLPGRSSSYSTMPKISDKPAMSPMASPRNPGGIPDPAAVIKVPEPPEDPPQQQKGGCGCCIVM